MVAFCYEVHICKNLTPCWEGTFALLKIMPQSIESPGRRGQEMAGRGPAYPI